MPGSRTGCRVHVDRWCCDGWGAVVRAVLALHWFSSLSPHRHRRVPAQSPSLPRRHLHQHRGKFPVWLPSRPSDITKYLCMCRWDKQAKSRLCTAFCTSLVLCIYSVVLESFSGWKCVPLFLLQQTLMNVSWAPTCAEMAVVSTWLESISVPATLDISPHQTSYTVSVRTKSTQQGR